MTNPTPTSVAHLSPIILEVTQLSWDNLVETHSRWSEEIISLCALAGNGVYESLQIPPPHHRKDHHQKKTKNSNKKKRSKSSQYDDYIARSIIILCMTRDLRDRFNKFMKVANTSKRLFNGIAILKEAVAEGQFREREAGGFVPEAILHNIRMKALAMAQEVDWKSTSSTSAKRFSLLSFVVNRWRRRARQGCHPEA